MMIKNIFLFDMSLDILCDKVQLRQVHLLIPVRFIVISFQPGDDDLCSGLVFMMGQHLPVEVDTFCVVVVIRVDRVAHPLGDVVILPVFPVLRKLPEHCALPWYSLRILNQVSHT